ncbi:MAG: ribose-phosphate diphosphokinase [Nanoarchaeota archaeon]
MTLLIASFKETKDLAKQVARRLKCKYTEIIVKDFPDEESYVKLKENPKGKTLVIFNSFARDQNDRLIESTLAAGIGKDYKAKKIILAAPYFPYLRQDTHFKKFDSFSIKHIKDILDNFDSILTIDPHLQRIKNIKKISYKMKRLTSTSQIAAYIKKNFKSDFTIVGPDEESKQWAQGVASKLGKKAIILKKKRFSWHKVKIQEKNLGKNVIIIDDIIGTGHTILETIKVAKHHRAKKITVIGIHGVLVDSGMEKKITKQAKLLTTNTIKNKYAKIDVSPVIAEALKT